MRTNAYLNPAITPAGIIFRLFTNLVPKNTPRKSPTTRSTLADWGRGNCVVAKNIVAPKIDEEIRLIRSTLSRCASTKQENWLLDSL